ncbi:5-hydroxytryptamine receptor 3A [Hondaea fermentalgiana]|uniref:5-hydroxytryptamine receptor 3A n=1 Tax=Hondaea fermentalgiana TaxID=2315210 RepID=A0A2R5G6E1_9STRA|nr:5-hydroxytryptamine receptor 3A [Hondaea fermentalgiana]|eukprot:GBG26622.1 5-hydroxytryptamine receptor 3A [Hondaea fermentalgiana]
MAEALDKLERGADQNSNPNLPPQKQSNAIMSHSSSAFSSITRASWEEPTTSGSSGPALQSDAEDAEELEGAQHQDQILLPESPDSSENSEFPESAPCDATAPQPARNNTNADASAPYLPSMYIDDRLCDGLSSYPSSDEQRRYLEIAKDWRQRQPTTSMPMEMFIRVNIHDVCSIDTKNQTFTANMYWQVMWFAPENFMRDDPVKVALEEAFDPRVHLANLVRDSSSAIQTWIEFGKVEKGKHPGRKVVFRRQKLVGAVFRSQYNLERFPLDTQTFDIELRCDFPSNVVSLQTLEPSPGDPKHDEHGNSVSFAKPSKFTTSNEFEWFKNLTVVTSSDKQSKNSFGKIVFRLMGDRKPGFITINVLIPTFVLTGLGLVVFAIQPEKLVADTLANANATAAALSTAAVLDQENANFERRFNVNCVLLLTQVTLKFSASVSLPEVSYPTFADYAVIAGVLFQSWLIIWTAIIKTQTNWERATFHDHNCMWASAALFGLVTIVIVSITIYKWCTLGHVRPEKAKDINRSGESSNEADSTSEQSIASEARFENDRGESDNSGNFGEFFRGISLETCKKRLKNNPLTNGFVDIVYRLLPVSALTKEEVEMKCSHWSIPLETEPERPQDGFEEENSG